MIVLLSLSVTVNLFVLKVYASGARGGKWVSSCEAVSY